MFGHVRRTNVGRFIDEKTKQIDMRIDALTTALVISFTFFCFIAIFFEVVVGCGFLRGEWYVRGQSPTVDFSY